MMAAMMVEDSPFPPSWWGTGLSAAGVAARPDVGTYGRYEFAALPPVPFTLTGDFGWLRDQPAATAWAISEEAEGDLPVLLAACDLAGVTLPPSAVEFLGSPGLPARIRSSTACFLDVGAAPVPSPTGSGHLVRFLSDQQGCLYWYLFLPGGDAAHAVVCSPDFYGTAEENEGPLDEPESPGPANLTYAAESFEAFLCRFWLENEIWFARTGGGTPPAGAEEYLERYRAALR